MKTLSNFIDENNLIDELCSYPDIDIVNEGILKAIADWFGSFGGNIYNKINNFYDELYHFPDNIIKAFNGTLLNATVDSKKETIQQKEKQDTISKIVSSKPTDIPKKVIEILKNNENNKEFTSSPFIASLCVLGIKVARENKDKESEDIIQSYFNRLDKSVKDEAIENIKNTPKKIDIEKIVKKPTDDDKKVEEPKKDDDKPVDDKPTEDDLKDISKKVVDDVVKEEPKKDELNEEELLNVKNSIFYALNDICDDKEIENKDYDELEKIAKELAKIFLGVIELNKSEIINDDILKKYGIENLEEFKSKILNK